MRIHTENHISIHADAQTVYETAANVEQWPRILQHYRYVTVLGGSALESEERLIAMSARRSRIPVRWTSTQLRRRDRLQISYHHVAGVTRGMDVLWTIVESENGVEVRIDHDLQQPRWWLRWRVAAFIVGEVFVTHIADQTLRGVKSCAEARVTARTHR